MRKTIFANEEYYHIYNRGVDKREVFLDKNDYFKFLSAFREFNDDSKYEQRIFAKNQSSKELSSFACDLPKLVEIICYCLNPNHYHLILKQLRKDGIKTFMHKLGTGYTNYFNKEYDRSGSLFQGPFKAIHIDSNEYLLYLSAYVNKNNFIHGYEKGAKLLESNAWQFSSYLDYIGKRNGKLCNKEPILGQFRNLKDCKEFLDKNAACLKEKKELEKYLLE